MRNLIFRRCKTHKSDTLQLCYLGGINLFILCWEKQDIHKGSRPQYSVLSPCIFTSMMDFCTEETENNASSWMLDITQYFMKCSGWLLDILMDMCVRLLLSGWEVAPQGVWPFKLYIQTLVDNVRWINSRKLVMNMQHLLLIKNHRNKKRLSSVYVPHLHTFQQ